MKAEFLKIAGVKSEAEFYKKFPSEEAFMKKHGKAVKSLMAKKAQVGTMIPNITTPAQNPTPVRIDEEFLYNAAARQTGRKSMQEMRDDEMYQAQMAKLTEKKPNLLQQLLNPLGDPDALGNLFGETEDVGVDSITGDSSGGGKVTNFEVGEPKIIGIEGKYGGKVKKAGTGMGVNYSSDPTEYLQNTTPTTTSSDDENPLDKILNSKAVKIGAPIVADIASISNTMQQQKSALQSAQQSAAVAEIAAQAAGTMPEKVERQYVRPEDIQNTGEEFFPIYGVGTNVLAKNGGMYKAQDGGMFSDTGYIPLVNPNQQKQFKLGGVLGSNSYLVPKAEGGFNLSDASYGGGGAGGVGMKAGQAMGFTDAGSQIGGKIGGTIGSLFGPVGSAVGSFIGSGIGDLADRDDRRTQVAQDKAERDNLKLATAAVAPAIQANYASHVRNGGKIPSNPSMLDTMAMGGDVKTTWGGKVETVSYNPYAGGESIQFKGNSHDYRDPRTGQTGIGVAYGKDSVANNQAVVEVENEPAQQLRDGGGTENLVVYGDLKIPEEYISEINDERAKGMKFKNYVSNVLNKDEAKANTRMEKAAEKGLEADNTKWGKLELSTADAIVNGGDMKLKSIADKKNILADLQNALNETFDEYGVKGNEFIAKNKIVEDPERMMNNMAKSGIEIKPENEGKFTAWAKERGMSVAEAANKVMANTDEYSEGVVKMANFAKNARKFKKGEDGIDVPKLQDGTAGDVSADDFNRQLGGGDIPTTDKTVEELLEDKYVLDKSRGEGVYVKQIGDKVVAVKPSGKSLGYTPEGQSIDEGTGLAGGITMEQISELEKKNPWFGKFDFSKPKVKWKGKMVHPDVLRFQQGYNRTIEGTDIKPITELDGVLGQETFEASYIPGAEGKPAKEEVVKVKGESTTATQQKLTPIPGRAIPPTIDYPLDPNQLLAEQYAMATGQVQPVFAQGYSPQLRNPYDISLQTAKNDVIAQSRVLERNPALQNNPAALALLQAPTYTALNKINEAEFMANQKMKDTVYSGNIDAINKARMVNLGIYDTQADRMADAASKTRTQNIDILSSISNKYAQNRRENMMERVYGNMYPSFAYDKDGNIIQTGSASFSLPQGMVGGYSGFTNMGGAAGTVQNILAGAQMLGGQFTSGREKQTPVVSEGLTPMGPITQERQLTRLAPTPQQIERMYFESLVSPVDKPGEVTAQMIQDPAYLSRNWWEEETPQGKKGKTIKKNNKNSNILKALRNL